MADRTDASDVNWSNSDYEIKEQDRFLPIANGESLSMQRDYTNISWASDEERIAPPCKAQ